MLDIKLIMVFTQSMETIKDQILTLAGGSMSTDTLNVIAFVAAFVFIVLATVAIVFALNWHKVKSVNPKTPVIIHNAQ